jgi:transcriptional regulator with XRE-family HTH domain
MVIQYKDFLWLLSSLSLVACEKILAVKFFFSIKYMNYGKRLRSKRLAKNLSQERLAEMVTSRGHTITGANISIIERGYDKRKDGEATRPHRRFVEIASELLGDDVDQALMDADYAPIHRPHSTDEGLFSGLHRLSEEDQRRARRQIKAIIESYEGEEQGDENYDYIEDEDHSK